MMLDMDHTLMVLLLLLWSSGFRAEEVHDHTESVRLMRGDRRCEGTLEVKLKEWKPVSSYDWTLKEAAVVCRDLDCGSAVSIQLTVEPVDRSVWRIRANCLQSGSALKDCVEPWVSTSTFSLTCSDSVRLVNGTSLCSGRLEVKSNQTNQSDQRWSSVCDADFDQQDAEVVCRELGCGAPSVLQGALYGEVEAPTWTKEFQCGGHESALLDCRSSGSLQTSCPSGQAARLTCSEPVRLVGGDSRCAGTLEVKQGEWRPVEDFRWTLKDTAAVCRDLDCGSAVSAEKTKKTSVRQMWRTKSNCVQSGSALKDCVRPWLTSSALNLTCSGQQGADVTNTDGH